MRIRNCEPGGLGHSLVDALIHEFRQPTFPGFVSGGSDGGSICAHYLVQRRTDKGQLQGRVFNVAYDIGGDEVRVLRRFEYGAPGADETGGCDFSKARERIEAALQNAIIEWLPDRQSRAGLQISLVGLHSG